MAKKYGVRLDEECNAYVLCECDGGDYVTADEHEAEVGRLQDELEAMRDERDAAVVVCRRLLKADKENKTGYPTAITPDMILAARSVVKDWETML